jgi:hypothetical protein
MNPAMHLQKVGAAYAISYSGAIFSLIYIMPFPDRLGCNEHLRNYRGENKPPVIHLELGRFLNCRSAHFESVKHRGVPPGNPSKTYVQVELGNEKEERRTGIKLFKIIRTTR